MSNKDLKIPVIIVLVIAIISLGVAFAAFNSSLTINGNSTIDPATWDIVFEGLDSEHPTVLGSPTIPQGSTASVITAPTINNNQTDISSFQVSLSSPGDSITYNFKVHNRGTVAARVTALDIQQGIYLTTDTGDRVTFVNTLNNIEYKLYYTESNLAMGSDNDRDCLSPGESELVSLRIVFLDSNDESVLPSSDLVLDNLGITVTYTSESSCSSSSGGGGNSGNNQAVGGVYYLGDIYNNETDETDFDVWGDLADFSLVMPAGYENVTPEVFLKRINGNVNICQVANSVEHCVDGTETIEEFAQFCETLYPVYDYVWTEFASESGISCSKYGDDDKWFVRYYPVEDSDGFSYQIMYDSNGLQYNCGLSFDDPGVVAGYDCGYSEKVLEP